MGEYATNLGVDIFPGTAGSSVLISFFESSLNNFHIRFSIQTQVLSAVFKLVIWVSASLVNRKTVSLLV